MQNSNSSPEASKPAAMQGAMQADSVGPTPFWMGVTLGDPSGIGPEVVLKAHLSAPQDVSNALLFAYKAVIERALCFLPSSDRLCLVPMRLDKGSRQGDSSPSWQVRFEDASQIAPKALQGKTPVYFVDLGALSLEAQATFLQTHASMPSPTLSDLTPMGQINAQSGEFAARAVVAATRAALHGLTRGVVTAPLHKESLALAGWPYPGHTELLQDECAQFFSTPIERMPVRMMLKNRELAVVLVSIHVSLRQAIERVTHDNVLSTLQISHDALKRTLGRPPKMALSALNPHAGEGGLMGHEEEEILKPALQSALTLGLDVQGPFAPDTIYMRVRQERLKAREMPQALSPTQTQEQARFPKFDTNATAPFDVVIAMYHDQGLIPVKYLGLEQGVNVTLGLPLVRTSPDHGTAFDLAGSGLADEGSFLEAYREAQVMSSSKSD